MAARIDQGMTERAPNGFASHILFVACGVMQGDSSGGRCSWDAVGRGSGQWVSSRMSGDEVHQDMSEN